MVTALIIIAFVVLFAIVFLVLYSSRKAAQYELQLEAERELVKQKEEESMREQRIFEDQRLKSDLGASLVTDWKYEPLDDVYLAKLIELANSSDQGTTLRFWDDQMTADFGISVTKTLPETLKAVIFKDKTFWYKSCYGDSNLGKFLFYNQAIIFTYHNVLFMARRIGEVKSGRRGAHIEICLTPIFSRVRGTANLVLVAEAEMIANRVSRLS